MNSFLIFLTLLILGSFFAMIIAAFPYLAAPFILNRTFQPKPVILWLRRFHIEQRPRFPVSRMLFYLSFFGMRLVTLRDSRTKGASDFIAESLIRALAWSIVITIISVTLLFTALGLSKASIFDWQFWAVMKAAEGFGILIAVLLVWGVPIVAAGVVFARITGGTFVRARRNENASKFVNRRLHAMARYSIIESKNEDWRETVSALVSVADVILIDIDNPSSNIEWEIKEILRHDRVNDTILLGSQARMKTAVSDCEKSIHKNQWGDFANRFVYPEHGLKADFRNTLIFRFQIDPVFFLPSRVVRKHAWRLALQILALLGR